MLLMFNNAHPTPAESLNSLFMAMDDQGRVERSEASGSFGQMESGRSCLCGGTIDELGERAGVGWHGGYCDAAAADANSHV
jgi:hypothetical protein